MAIERRVPKDISHYEPKLMLGLTTKQLLCLIPMIAVGALVVFGIGPTVSLEMRLFLLLPALFPFVLVGWVKVYKQPFVSFVKTAFVSLILSPPKRKYKCEKQPEDATPESPKKLKEKAIKKIAKKSQNKDVIAYL